MSWFGAEIGLLLWFAAVALFMWVGLGGPPLASVAALCSFLVGSLLVTQWMMSGGMPRP